MKAVNMKNYKFRKTAGGFTYYFNGFGIYDEETESFVSVDGKKPFVLDRKYIAESCIKDGWPQNVKMRVSAI